jgi:hypothetical protein
MGHSRRGRLSCQWSADFRNALKADAKAWHRHKVEHPASPAALRVPRLRSTRKRNVELAK